MFNVFAGLFHLAAEALLTAGGPSWGNKSNYENKPTQLLCKGPHLLNEWEFYCSLWALLTESDFNKVNS